MKYKNNTQLILLVLMFLSAWSVQAQTLSEISAHLNKIYPID